MAPRIINTWVLRCQIHTEAKFATSNDLFFFFYTFRLEAVWASESF